MNLCGGRNREREETRTREPPVLGNVCLQHTWSKFLGRHREPGSGRRVAELSTEKMLQDVKSSSEKEQEGARAMKLMDSREFNSLPLLCIVRKAS